MKMTARKPWGYAADGTPLFPRCDCRVGHSMGCSSLKDAPEFDTHLAHKGAQKATKRPKRAPSK